MKRLMRSRTLPMIAVAAFVLLAPWVARAGGVDVTIIDGRKAKADVTLPNPLGGNFTAEFELEFERDGLQNLTVACLGLSADVLDATEIADIQGRLPHTDGTQKIDLDFAVRITVEPPAGCGLAFNNHYDVSLETDDLVYQPGSQYRLVKAPLGGTFDYVTGEVTQGSVRSRGRTGGFSEFVIIRDTQQQAHYSSDCVNQYDRLATRIQNMAISPTARHALEVDLAVSRAAYDAGNFTDAIARLASFDAHCAAYGGDALPNRWRSTRDLDNIEGDLVGHTDTLRFLMGRLAGSP